ncbi:cellulose synthase complex periplasmic endoglucanase BcsZ [Halomonas sp. PR-M31]|uniref:cellulose synthase complex periplasmic endoglucanase BcsZ n=1 Tax=Halomonas sp. PR-M31 TaxID=1471202 RepID=UPI0009E2BFA8|nr:cellulose synthase complex periplasmic endoglucanase BcsZ [Halomonas sp. PR-M31]
MRGLLCLLGPWLLGLCLLAPNAQAASVEWPLWERFKNALISDDGRVIDVSDERMITTSEGQSYALFFALVANDQDTFERLLAWTQNNLAESDLGARLPAWLWGHDESEDRWGVLDANSASDADLWIAYTLLEAGNLWQRRDYQVLGTRMARLIADQEVTNLEGFGPMLLPGKRGFADPPRWRVNPSYVPPQILSRLSALGAPWDAVAENVPALLKETAPQGFAPDWAAWRADEGWQVDPEHGAEGDYDAIRVYLWLGMLAKDAPGREALLVHFAPMALLTKRLGAPPESIDAQSGEHEALGNASFSAALLPFLADTPFLEEQRQRLLDNFPAEDAYYAQVLTLFGLGWDQGRYRFANDGTLQPEWSSP